MVKIVNTRKYWLDTMLKIVTPVLEALSEDRLKADMPIEAKKEQEEYEKYVYLEVFGRVLMGIAPWLGCKGLSGKEEELRRKYCEMTRKCIAVAVNPDCNDCFNFVPRPNSQPIVDAAFLAQGILRAPNELWEPLDDITKKRLLDNMRKTRQVKPGKNNWLLFSAMIEAMLCYAGANDWDSMRIDYALTKHMDWYKGDGWYGDGEKFHTDYYNSFVIQPMLVDILNIVGDRYPDWEDMKTNVLKRAIRFATVQERLISPEGTYPPIGRSLAYRFGAFQCLAQMAYMETLEEYLEPAQVRCGLTAVIRKILSFPDMFDKNGWLKIGVCGYQPNLGEHYISTASLYLCSAVFLPLGLPENAPFWSDPDSDWTQKRFWNGENMERDHRLYQ